MDVHVLFRHGLALKYAWGPSHGEALVSAPFGASLHCTDRSFSVQHGVAKAGRNAHRWRQQAKRRTPTCVFQKKWVFRDHRLRSTPRGSRVDAMVQEALFVAG